jgi:hypothetical protein
MPQLCSGVLFVVQYGNAGAGLAQQFNRALVATDRCGV